MASVPGNMIKDAGAALEAAVGSTGLGTDATRTPLDALHTGGGAEGGGHSKEQEDADMALAVSLQAEWEEEERRVQQRQQLEQQAQQQPQRASAPVVGQVVSPATGGGAGRQTTAGATAGGGRAGGGGGTAVSRQRAGADGGVAAEQMALYQLAQQEKHAEARTREQQHGAQQPSHSNAPAHPSYTQQQQQHQQVLNTII